MNKIKELFRCLLYDRNKIKRLLLYRCSPLFSDEKYLKKLYKFSIGRELNLERPQTFNEKLQWLKLYNRRPEYTQMVDKFAVKEYIANIIGEEYIIPTLGVYDKAEEIDFDELPDQFVLKCTHDSGLALICKDKTKFDRKDAIKKLNKSLKRNYYWWSREWPYKNVQPRIIAEKYMIDDTVKELRDYKFFCFNGRVELYKVDYDRFVNHRANYFTREGEILPFGEETYPPDSNKDIQIPNTISQMISIADKLSGNLGPFARVDLYSANDKIYFGEITFFPSAGFGRFTDPKWDRKLGDLMRLNS